MYRSDLSPRQRLVAHVQELERLQEVKALASADLKDGFERAQADGYDTTTLKVVLKLRSMTPAQRRERRALEAIYMASLGMLEGDPLPDEARRRLDGDASREDHRGGGGSAPAPDAPAPDAAPPDAADPERRAGTPEAPPTETQPPLIVKDPAEARTEGAEAAAAGQRIYDNPYQAGDPCRAAWDEGWCAQQKSHGMETPAAYQRRTAKPPGKDDKDEKRDKDGGAGPGDVEKGAA